MERRKFLASSLVSAAAASLSARASGAQEQGPSAASSVGEFYELRRYRILSGPQRKLADDYFANALIPALNRLGVKPVGVFNTSIGDDPSAFILMPAAKVEILIGADQRLAADAEYQKAGAAFLNAPARDPGFLRMENSLLSSITAALPKLTPPPTMGPRIFEMRTYESTTDQDHRRKVEMMGAGEIAIFKKYGFWPIFVSDTLIGPRQPCLTYMLGFPSLADREKSWNAFFGAPEWKALNTNERYSFEPLVSAVNNVILAPAAYSQI